MLASANFYTSTSSTGLFVLLPMATVSSESGGASTTSNQANGASLLPMEHLPDLAPSVLRRAPKMNQGWISRHFSAPLRVVLGALKMINLPRYLWKWNELREEPACCPRMTTKESYRRGVPACEIVNDHGKATVYPRLWRQYNEATELVGIDETRDEVVRILLQGDEEASDEIFKFSLDEEVTEKHGRIVSLVGFKGLGKTALANAVYENIRARFLYCAFVSVPQTLDMKKLFRDMLRQFDEKQYCRTIFGQELDQGQLINRLVEFLQEKRYFVVIDDIWDISVWELIRCALPDNYDGYKIITTTCSFKVAEQIGGAYKMKPLSLDNSRILFHRRIFGEEYKDQCLNEQLTEVSDKILKKCSGVPLAITKIASLLAGKDHNATEWYNVYNSIDFEFKNGQSMESMVMILSLRYHVLPSHLKTCLLYLSVFPEDYEISKHRLIWMWIAEGFIQCKEQERNLFELGESYLNELINRGMIHPTYGWNSAMIQYCRVHDIVLDLIRSHDENFVTVLDYVHYHIIPSEKVQRLSLQNSNGDYATPNPAVNMEQVRSVTVFPSSVSRMPPLSSFRVVRVLDLEDNYLSRGYSLNSLGRLFHLRYLRLRDRGISQLPEEIGSLQFLQTLDVMGTGISSLPSTVALLKNLMCLRIDSRTRVPNGIGSLTSLEELSTICIDNFSYIIEELGCLRELRVLGIDCRNGWDFNSLEKSPAECLNRLQKIKSLYISVFGECNLNGWDTTQHLRRLEISGCWSSTLPSWMKQPLLVQDLSSVSIEIRKLCQEDLEILGMLPALSFLDLEVDHEDLGRFVIGACSFPSLVHCALRGSVGPVEFRQEAMPRLTNLCLTFHVRETRQIAECSGGFDMGLEKLKSLQDVTISFLYDGGASEGDAEKAEAALKHAVENHPNHPTLQIR